MLLTFLALRFIFGNISIARNPNVSMPQMVHVKGRTFTMANDNGIADEITAHQITQTRFYFGKYEVTYQDLKNLWRLPDTSPMPNNQIM